MSTMPAALAAAAPLTVGRRVAARFAEDIADHQLLGITLDAGLYRHLRFRRPGTSMYWFDIITWPGSLAIRGDMGSFVFARVEDMLTFFRGQHVNPRYWAEKEVTGARTQAYSPDRFVEQVAEAVSDDGLAYWGLNERDLRQVREAARALCVHEDVHYEDGARRLLDEFSVPVDHATFGFHDTWEWDLRDWTTQYLWCCHAIVWAIQQYDAARGAAR